MLIIFLIKRLKGYNNPLKKLLMFKERKDRIYICYAMVSPKEKERGSLCIF